MPANDVTFGFDSLDVQDQKWIERIMRYKRSRALGVPHDLVRHTKRTKVGAEFVLPCARMFVADQPYTAAQICLLLGAGWSPKRVASKLNTLGRIEKKHGGIQVFGRPMAGHYTLTQKMLDALNDATV